MKAISLANLILLPVWVEMAPGAGARYLMGYNVGVPGLAALGLNILLCGPDFLILDFTNFHKILTQKKMFFAAAPCSWSPLSLLTALGWVLGIMRTTSI
ncbi:MAG: hypothetical protein IPN59_09295 [Holophaga sp.]|nr:hypothetical protein [Holophaga sp.]